MSTCLIMKSFSASLFTWVQVILVYCEERISKWNRLVADNESLEKGVILGVQCFKVEIVRLVGF